VVVPIKPDEYRVDVQYDGKGRPGDFLSVIRVFTDDPRQGPIEVSASGKI
jgi:hypothetical protein